MLKFCTFALFAAANLCFGPAFAQAFPNRAIRLVVPYSAGQGADLVARRLASRMAANLGQPVVIDNRPGAGGNIGSDIVAKSKPDGYTLVLGTSATHAANQFLYSKMPYDAATDFTPIVPIVSYGMILAVNPGSTFMTLPDLIKQAKAKPGGYEAALPSTTSRLVLELFRTAAGVDILPVPYVGSSGALTDSIAGRVAMVIDTSSALLGHIKSGALRPLAIATEKRLESYPDVPTFRESGADVVAPPVNGLFGPRQLPPQVVQEINAAVNKAFADRELFDAFVREGAQPIGGTADDLERFMRIERGKWERLVKATGLRVE